MGEKKLKQWTDDIDPHSIPDHVVASENGRRNALKRTNYTGGVYWKKHKPDYPRCRCVRCMKKRGYDVPEGAAA